MTTDPAHRDLARAGSQMRMRIHVTPTGFWDRSERPRSLSVEWASRVGHPSSYGLLGGRPYDTPLLSVASYGAIYKESLAGPADKVRWGLPDEYRTIIQQTLAAQPAIVAVTEAAAAAVGSSAHVFATLATMLATLSTSNLLPDDAELWRLWDRCWNDT